MTRLCPTCQTENPDEARFCFNESCRQALDAGPEAGVVFQPVAPKAGIPTWLKVLVPVGVVGLAAGGIALALGGGSSPKTPAAVATTAAPTTAAPPSTTTAPATTTVAAAPKPVPLDLIAKAEASSTLPDSDGLSYGVERTLDGRDNTAWNSAGSTGGADPVGQTLTYTFTSPQHIVAVRIWNGFSRPTPDRTFTDNYRVKGLVIRAGGKEVTVELADQVDPQRLDHDFGTVDSVQLEITSVYDTTKWKDVALTEVQFFAP